MLSWTLIALALAQTEVCSPEPVARWREQIGAAQAALLAVETERAETLLDEIHRGAQCLSDVVPVELLGRYAQLRTIRSVYDQDLILIEEWGRMAQGFDVPWPVPAEHPVHRFLGALDDEPPAPPRPDRVFAPPRRGAVFVDGAWAPSPPSDGLRHLVQVFDGEGVRVKAWWQTGVVWDEQLLTTGAPAEPPRWFQGPGMPEVEERPEWRLARKDKLRAYESYLSRHPDGEYAPLARRRIDDLVWDATPRTPAGATSYLARFPEGRNKGGAEAVLQGMEYQLALEKGSTEALQLFLGRYPNGVYAAAARRQLDERAWVEALVEGTEQAYARYRVRWPQGVHFEEARIAQDDMAWKAADGKGRKAVEAYLRAWPQGGHVLEARAFLKGLTFRTLTVTVDGNGPAEAVERIDALVIEELAAAGFERVEGDGQADLHVTVDELSVGEGLSRLVAKVVLTVPGSELPLSRQEVLIDPIPMSAAIDELAEGLVPVVRGLSRWKRAQ